jgi:signal transduction histidine kinase
VVQLTDPVDDDDSKTDLTTESDRTSDQENESSTHGEAASGAGSLSVCELIDAERSQIGHDLHDQLLPLIFAASANLQAVLDRSQAAAVCEGNVAETAPVDSIAPGTVARERIAQASQWLREAMSVGRNLLTEVYPPELQERSWLAATRETVNRICQGHCQTEWEMDPDSTVCRSGWNSDVAAAAYRIVVEAVRNAVRHGEADRITITGKGNRLVVADDGKGFDPAKVPAGHFGIRSMKGRAALVGQQLTIDSRPGGPTNVILQLTD